MFSNTRNFGRIIRRDKWLLLSGIILAVILAVAVRTQRVTPKMELPSKEPVISVYFHEKNQVKKMPLETYLEGVVAAEMDPNWPLKALEAQAIVARTFTLKKMHEGPLPAKGTDASTDPKEFQAYNAAKVNDKVRQAIRNTRGQVITYAGHPINAWFHASSGGKTASATEGLGFRKEATPYVVPMTDIQRDPTHVWASTFSNAEIVKAARTLGVPIDSVRSISIGRKGPSGRAETLIINGREIPAPSFRVALGGERMRSTLLDEIRLEGNQVFMRGRGYGHGVGMSQWGAWLLAQRGKSSHDIIKYYFKGVQIQDLW